MNLEQYRQHKRERADQERAERREQKAAAKASAALRRGKAVRLPEDPGERAAEINRRARERRAAKPKASKPPREFSEYLHRKARQAADRRRIEREAIALEWLRTAVSHEARKLAKARAVQLNLDLVQDL